MLCESFSPYEDAPLTSSRRSPKQNRWHVVLNVADATALSVSLALRRDIDALVPALLREDVRFGMHWLDTLKLSDARREALLRASRA